MNDDRLRLAQEIAIAVEVTGGAITKAALAAMVEDLIGYGDAAIAAVRKARRECQRITLASIVERVEHADGHPGPEEAWALVPVNEDDSTVWTDEIATAAGAAAPLIARGDLIAARLAFRDSYTRLVDAARAERRPPKWTPSLGRDARRRAAAIERAVDLRRLPAERASAYLPAPEASPAVLGAIAGLAALPAPQSVSPELLRARVAALRAALTSDERRAGGV